MKMNFYFPMFLLMVSIPFFLLEFDYSKTDKVEFVFSKKGKNIEKDSLRIFEVFDGEEEEYPIRFNEDYRSKGYFLKDSLNFRMNASGYILSIELFEEKFKTTLRENSNCRIGDKMIIKNQLLRFEDFNLIHKGKIRGEYSCQAIPKESFDYLPQEVRIRGHFELDLVDVPARGGKFLTAYKINYNTGETSKI